MSDPAATSEGTGTEMAYAGALEELLAILADLERENPDVDRLAAQVARAAELIEQCRSRIAAARFDVSRVLADLDADRAT